MRSVGTRIFACILAVLACFTLVQAWQQARLAPSDELSASLRWLAAVTSALATVLLACEALRLVANPSALLAYPFHRSPAWYRWLLAGWLLVFLSLGLAFPGVDVARYPCRALCALWLALLLSPLLWPAAWLETGRRAQKRSPFRSADLLVGNLVVAIILLELGVRAVSAWSGEDALLAKRTLANRLRPQSYHNGLRANSLGFADEEFELVKKTGVLRIAALGDSFSVGAWVAYDDNYLTQLETLLPGVEVYNFGVCGTGPREYRQLLASTVWPYQPDLVLMPIFVGNDVTEWIPTPELRKFHPDALYVELFLRRGYRLAREAWRTSRHSGGDFEMTILPPFSPTTHLELTAGRLVVFDRQATSSMEVRWRQVFTEMEGILADCQAHGVPVALVIIPDAVQVDGALRQRALAQRGWPVERLDVELPQRRLAAHAQAHGVPCLDLLPAFTPAGGDTYFANDSHWNAAGHSLAADHVCRWLNDTYRQLLQTSQTADRVP